MHPLLTTLICTLFLSLIGVCMRAAILRSAATGPISLVVATVGLAVGLIFGSEMELPLYGAIIASAVSAFAVHSYGTHRRNHLRKLKETAPALQTYVLRFFNQMDADGDGLITLGDLTVFAEKYSTHITPVRSQLLTILDRNLGLIGHVIGSGAVMAGMHGAAVYNIYGANREDITSWPERAARDYDQEFSTKETSA